MVPLCQERSRRLCPGWGDIVNMRKANTMHPDDCSLDLGLYCLQYRLPKNIGG